jgi:hypothetical protein
MLSPKKSGGLPPSEHHSTNMTKTNIESTTMEPEPSILEAELTVPWIWPEDFLTGACTFWVK